MTHDMILYMNTETFEKLIARRVRGGANETESRARLNELLATAGQTFLAYALHYEGFATATQADRIAEQVAA